MKSFISYLALSSFLFLIACQQTDNRAADVPADSKEKFPAVIARDAPAALKALQGTWYIEYIGDRPVIDHSPARIQFAVDGLLNGNASCNRFFGNYTYVDKQLKIPASLGATKMMCLPALMEQEQRLFEQLPMAHWASVENGLLILRDNQGKQVIKASRDETQ